MKGRLSVKHLGVYRGGMSLLSNAFPGQVYSAKRLVSGELNVLLAHLYKSTHSLPPRGATHILKSLFQSQADVGLNAGAFLPLPTKYFTEGRVRAGGTHRGV